jgi:hypothetical protein
MTEQLYEMGFEEQNRKYQEWKRQRVLEPVISFRGQNTLESYLYTSKKEKEEIEDDTFYPDIWFWDESNPAHPLRRYGYQFVLSRRIVTFIRQEEMIEKVKRTYVGEDRDKLLMELKKGTTLGYAIVRGMREQSARLYWELPAKASRCTGQLIRLNKLRLFSDDELLKEQLHNLSQSMAHKSWVAYVIKKDPNEVIDSLHLPPMFRIHQAKPFHGASWSIAFNVEAFQLWSICEQKKSEVF